MEAQKAPPPEVDPNLAIEQQQAQDKLVAGLQTQAANDTANLMARYGTRLALSVAGITPVTTTPAAGA